MFNGILLPIGLSSYLLYRGHERWPLLIPAAILLHTTLLSMAVVALERYAMPVVPFLLLLSAAAHVRVFERFPSQPRCRSPQ